MTQKLSFDGQICYYNSVSKILKTTIKEPFFAAGKILGWNPAVAGLGFNEKLINFVLTHKLRLIVFVDSVGHDYWLTWDKIQQFIKENNCDYKVGENVWVKCISWKTFITHHQHVEA